MQPDVLSAFLGHTQQQIKVFSTKKDVQPFCLDSRFIRKAFPFLLASAMVFTSCSEQKNKTSGNNTSPLIETVSLPTSLAPIDWNSIYQRVVQQYHLTSLKDKEPLTYKEIDQLMTSKYQVEPKDTNFNHAPANVDNFWEIVKGGISVAQKMQSNPKLSKEQKQQYLDKSVEALSKISKIKGTRSDVDLSDYNNLHAFLFFEKMLHYQDDADYIFHKTQGWIDENHELFGRYHKDYQHFEDKAKQYSGIEKFAKALYANNDRLIIAAEDSVYANALSRKMYERWRVEQNIKEEHLCLFLDVHDAYSANAIIYGHKRGMSVGISLEIDPKGQTIIDTYSPVGLTEIHESQHIMQVKPASYEKASDNQIASPKVSPQNLQMVNDDLLELGPTLYTLTMSDRIYKAIHKIDRDQEVDYGVELQFGDNVIGLGKIANWFGAMLEKYPSPSVDRVLGQKEVLEQLHRWGSGQKSSTFVMSTSMEAGR